MNGSFLPLTLQHNPSTTLLCTTEREVWFPFSHVLSCNSCSARNINILQPTARVKLLEPKLYDQVKAVRIEAAAALAEHKKSIQPAHLEAFDKALAQYRQAMVYNSDFAPQRYNYALVLLKLQRWQEGEQQLLWLLKTESGNSQYFTTLADVYLRFGMKERARILAQKQLEKHPDFQPARQLLNAL